MVRWRNARRSGRGGSLRASGQRSRRARLQGLEPRCVLTTGYLQTNLVSDQSGVALIRDFNLVDPWGIGIAPSGGAFWVADQGSGSATLYAGDVSGTPFARNPLVVSVPGGSPTGQVANGTPDFSVSLGALSGPAAFLMAEGNGAIAGWNQDIPLPAPSSQAQLGLSNASAVYTGLTIANDGAGNLLYAANYSQGTIDVFDRNFSPVSVVGDFADGAVPAGFAPYNIANLGGKLYVAYARQNAGHLNPTPGSGGFVAVFDYQGRLQKNLSSSGVLDAPWGMALAPATFGDFSGQLLVGNWGNGRIEAFNPNTGALVGALASPGGGTLSIDGLRGLSFGNGVTAGDFNSLYFTAGPGGGQHGLFGAIKSAQAAPLTAAGANVTAYAGLAFNGVVATFTDGNASLPAGSYATTINWGDGSSSAGTVASLGGGRFNLLGTHLYSQVGLQSITVSINDSAFHAAFASGLANVKTLDLSATAAAISATEDAAFSGAVAAFSDADGNLSTGAYHAWIDWGDGTVSPGIIAGDGSGGFTVTGTHVYVDEADLTVRVSIVDSDGDEITVTGNALVADADSLTASPLAIMTTEGAAYSGAVAKFSDINLAAIAAEFTALIDWGDGVTNSGVVTGANGQFTVNGQHTFAHSGQYNVKVTVRDPAPGTASASATATAVVADAPITAAGATFAAVEGQSFSGIVARFASDNPGAVPGDFTATIDWGDGATTSGSVNAASGTFNVVGVHAYAATSAGIVSKVYIARQGGGAVTVEGMARVADAPLVATATTVSGFEKTALVDVKLAGFVDQGVPLAPSAYAVTIDWGDGVTTAGAAAVDGAGFKILGTHAYDEIGTYSFSVVVADGSGSSATVHGSAVVLAELLWNGTRGTPVERWINEVYVDLLGRLADPGALAYWNSLASQGVNRNLIVSAIEGSGEYRARQVQAMFQRYLHRSVDSGGQAYFVSQLAAGATMESVAATLIGSPEYFMNRGGGANDSFLNALYQDVLRRPVDAGGSAYFGRLLAAGVSRSQVAGIILNSDEYRALLIGDYYQQLLGHPTSSGSISFWLSYMKQGGRDEQVVAAIAGSDEYFGRTSA